MLSGQRTLSEIDGALRTARSEMDRLDSDLNWSSESLASNRRSQARALKELAAMRLDLLEQGEFIDSLDSADHRAKQLLDEREQAIELLESEIEQNQHELAELEDRRKSAHRDVDDAAKRVAELEAQTQESLDQDAAYLAQLERTRDAESVVSHAEEKLAQAEAVQEEKGRPFREDALFEYLWSRHYGTLDYKAGAFARTMDAWVARLIDYETARRNYWMLTEIPKRLAQHVEQVKDLAEDELEQLQDIENAHAEAMGVLDAQEVLAKMEHQQDELDDALERQENELQQLRARHGTFVAGEDEYIKQSVGLLTESMQRMPVRELDGRARRTLTTEDDALVRELEDLRHQDRVIQEQLSEHRRLHAAHLERLKELEDVRRRFKRRRFDDLRSSFGNEQLIMMMLNEFLRGGVRGSVLWDVLKRQQRYRDVGGAWPDFGSGGFPQRRTRSSRRRGSPWHWPGGRGGFRIPRGGGSSSRGGFRTRGGF